MSDLIEKPVQIRLEFHWHCLGQAQWGKDSRLLFPSAPRRPGLYRFRLLGNGVAQHYVGETDEIRRRFQHYRTPGKSQQTNIRMNAELRDHLAASGRIEIDIVTKEVAVVAGGTPVDVGLADKATRRLLEHAALVDEAAAGAILLNR